jgi:hypothetical protein
MVFGSILAATDPALLKSAGASPKLTILIIGESLLNDGTAMVLFTLFFDMVKGVRRNGNWLPALWWMRWDGVCFHLDSGGERLAPFADLSSFVKV